jgi:taurine dioxygenase
VRKLHPALGAEVRGVDLSQTPAAAVFDAIHRAWMEHLVLVFPAQAVSDAEHVAFSRAFGDLEVHHQDILKSRRIPEIFSVSNVDEDGELMLPANPLMAQVAQARRWHTDSSFRAVPSMGAMLHGIEVSRTGGETCFVNMYRVLEALPARLRRAVAGRKARHNYEHLQGFGNLRPLTEDERAAMPPVWQPMVRRHPVTGRQSLYLSPIYNDAVEGMEDAAAMELIDQLVAFAEREEFLYRHRWETDDVVLWDNRCTLHRVTPHDPAERRVMHRTSIVGDGPVLAA